MSKCKTDATQIRISMILKLKHHNDDDVVATFCTSQSCTELVSMVKEFRFRRPEVMAKTC